MDRFIRKILPLVAMDVVCFYFSLGVSVVVRLYLLPFLGWVPRIPMEFSFYHYVSMWWLLLFFIVFPAVEGLYTRRPYFWDELGKLWKASLLFVMVAFAVVALGHLTHEISRLTLVIMFFILLIVFPALRYYGKLLLLRMNLWVENAVIIGAGKSGRLLLSGLRRERTMGYRIHGFLDDSVKGSVDGVPVVGKISDVDSVLNNMRVDTVFIAVPSLPTEEIRGLFRVVSRKVANVYMIPNLLGIPSLNSELYYLFYEGLFVIYAKNKLTSGWRKKVKRLFDVAIVLVSFPVTLPLIAVLSVLVFLDDGKPVFFRGDRIGEGGNIFKCIKLRTMYNNADAMLDEYLKNNPEEAENWAKYKKLKGKDPRVTRFGRFLRRTSLDELPQIFNVLMGEMSIVGPRPYLPRNRCYMGDYYDDIVMVKPGITGLWQVSGRSELTFEDRMKLDVWYILSWSLWLDIVIILRTFAAVFRQEGAY